MPARWSTRQRLKNGAIYGGLRLAAWVWQRLPLAWAYRMAPTVGRLVGRVARRQRLTADAQLQLAMPHLSHAARRNVVEQMFVHLSRAALELGRLPDLLAGPQAVRLPESAHRVLQEAMAEGRGVVAVTGHIGNWELLAQVVAHAGFPVTLLAKPLYDPRLTRWVGGLRTRHGIEIVWRGASGAVKHLLRAFRRRRLLALLIDQDTKVAGSFVPFFGRPAFTPTAAASLARRFGCPIVVAWCQWDEGAHHIHVERLPDAGTQDPTTVTARMTERLEVAIRRHPEQWVWLHRRWRADA